MIQNWIRLPLEGAHNVRELGGLPAMEGGQTAWHRFLRADQLTNLTAADSELLRSYGVSTVIDLRSLPETLNHPDSPMFISGKYNTDAAKLRQPLSDIAQKKSGDCAAV